MFVGMGGSVPAAPYILMKGRFYYMVPSTFFYSKEPVFKRVTKQEFDEFIAKYPRRLVADAFGACEPPSITYNDFELANRWPHSIVARTFAYDDDPKGYYYQPEEERYYSIMENYKEVFASKTGKMVD